MLQTMTFNKISGNADDFSLKNWNTFWETNKPILIDTIAKTFELGYIPQSIKIFGAHLLPKPDGNLRTIKISNFFLKIYDQILSCRIKKILDSLIIKKTQFAYLDALDNIDLHIVLKETWKPNMTLIRTDISKAFDFVNTDYAIEELKRHMNISDVQMIQHFIHGRWLRIKVQDKRIVFS